MKALVTVNLKAGVLDPEGKAIGQALAHLGFSNVAGVRVGKLIELDLDVPDGAEAAREAGEMARRLLANGVIEQFKVEIVE